MSDRQDRLRVLAEEIAARLDRPYDCGDELRESLTAELFAYQLDWQAQDFVRQVALEWLQTYADHESAAQVAAELERRT